MAGYPQNKMNLQQRSTPFIGTSNYNQPYAQAGTSIPVDQRNDDLENGQQQPPQQPQGQLYRPGQGQGQGAAGQLQTGALYNQYNDNNTNQNNIMTPQFAMIRRGYGGYLNMQGQDVAAVPNYDQNYLSQINNNNNNFPGLSARFLMGQQQVQPQSAYFPVQHPPQFGYPGQDPSLFGFQAVKLIRRIWGTPCGARKSGAQILQCRQTCAGKAICKPVSCIVTTKCPKPKRCAAPACAPCQTCRGVQQQPQSLCQQCQQLECCCVTTPQCCCQARGGVKPCQCQCRVTPSCQQPTRRQCIVTKCHDVCPQPCCQHLNQGSLSLTSSQQQLDQLEQVQQAVAAVTCQQKSRQGSPIAKTFTDTGVNCSSYDCCISAMGLARRESSRNFSVRESRDFCPDRERRSPPLPPPPRDDDCCYDDYDGRCGGGGGGGGGIRGGGTRGCYYDNNCDDDYDNEDDYRFRCRPKNCDNYGRNDVDPCRQTGSCDSCESFERWRERCECRKKEREEAEKKAVDTKDGQNDPKPVDQATSEAASDDKLGHKTGKSVSVNTSKTKVAKASKSKLKASKSDGSVKTKGKKGAKDKKSVAALAGSRKGKKQKGGKKGKKK